MGPQSPMFLTTLWNGDNKGDQMGSASVTSNAIAAASRYSVKPRYCLSYLSILADLAVIAGKIAGKRGG